MHYPASLELSQQTRYIRGRTTLPELVKRINGVEQGIALSWPQTRPLQKL